jgi:hypothetical protein
MVSGVGFGVEMLSTMVNVLAQKDQACEIIGMTLFYKASSRKFLV